MKNPLLVPELRSALAANRERELREFLSAVHPVTAAELLGALDSSEVRRLLALAEPDRRAETFAKLDLDVQVELAQTLPRRELAEIVSHMAPDERADLVRALPEEVEEALLPALAHAEREDLRRLASYPEGSAGAVMTSDYATVAPDLTARQAIDELRRVAPDRETIYVAYVVDPDRRLIGHVSLRDLIVAPADRRVQDLMPAETVSVRVDDDQEAVARLIAKYDLLAIPVVDAAGVLVGIVTQDDAFDILGREQQEDLEKLMAIGGTHEAGAYLRTPALTHFRNRVAWVVGLAAMGLVSGWIIHQYEAALQHLLILALYMPMVADTGGNTGSQSATVIVRALALSEVGPRDVFRVLAKEFKVAALLAVILGVLAYGKVLFLSAGTDVGPGFSLQWVAIAISLALAVQVITATLIGALLPMAAAQLRLDPAVVSSPALTTVVDITGLLIYFSIAKVMLGF